MIDGLSAVSVKQHPSITQNTERNVNVILFLT